MRLGNIIIETKCSFPLTKLLAESGCENAVKYIEDLNSGAHYEWSSHHTESPTLSVALEWLRDEREVYIGVNYSPTMKLFFGTAIVNDKRVQLCNGTAEKYDDCLDQCMTECLTKYVKSVNEVQIKVI